MRVELVDLTCRTAPYDAHLVRALGEADVEARRWISGCLSVQRRQVDGVPVAAGLGLSERWLPQRARGRRALKALEYLLNFVLLVIAAVLGRADVVHFQWLPAPRWLGWLERAGLRALRGTGAAVMLTVHDVDPGLPTAAEIADLGRYAPLLERVLCHTASAREELVRAHGVPAGKTAVVPHGALAEPVDEAERRRARDRQGFGSSEVHGLFFGRIEPYKGLGFLLDGWERYRGSEDGEEARLHIVGRADARDEEAIRRRIRAGAMGGSVTCRFGYLPERELRELVAAADFCVFPYRAVTQSGALMYALGAGKAIVATRVGGVREAVVDGESGLLVDHGAVDDLAEALAALIRDGALRRKLERGARRSARTELDWENIGQRTREQYRIAVEGARAGATAGGERSP